jgi:hypothetical protein
MIRYRIVNTGFLDTSTHWRYLVQRKILFFPLWWRIGHADDFDTAEEIIRKKVKTRRVKSYIEKEYNESDLIIDKLKGKA